MLACIVVESCTQCGRICSGEYKKTAVGIDICIDVGFHSTFGGQHLTSGYVMEGFSVLILDARIYELVFLCNHNSCWIEKI